MLFSGEVYSSFFSSDPDLRGRSACCWFLLLLSPGTGRGRPGIFLLQLLLRDTSKQKQNPKILRNLLPLEKRTNFCLEFHRHGTDGTLLDGIDAGCRRGMRRRRRRDTEFSRYSRRRFSSGGRGNAHTCGFSSLGNTLKRDDDDETRILKIINLYLIFIF